MEWIVVDDGIDPIEDLVSQHPLVRYFRLPEKMPLGKKRNFMHDQARGDILVYMDDDDYYPPCRIQHAVETLMQHPEALCAGSSEMYIYFGDRQQMVQFGPYGPRHATAATFAFRRELLLKTRYVDDACLAEERQFLQGYTVPFVQLDPLKTILVFSHAHNSFDKRTLLGNPNDPYVRISTTKTINDFIPHSQSNIRRFFLDDLEYILENYPPGHPRFKPDVTEQITKIQTDRLHQIIQKQESIIQQLQLDNQSLVDKNLYLEKKVKELIQMRIQEKKLTKSNGVE
jgi:glycosyltransferase involved in cell wall biosynthesis